MDGRRFSTGSGRRGSDEVRATLRRKLPATVENASLLRREFQTWLQVDVEEDIAEDLVLAVYEALANAVEHAYRDRSGPMLLVARRTAEGVRVEVTDHGSWREDSSGDHRGRGIPLMHQLSSRTTLERVRGGGTKVVLHTTAPERTSQGRAAQNGASPARERNGASALTG